MFAGLGFAIEEKDFWKECPDIPEELDWLYTAFWRLVNEGSITFESMDRYARRYGINGTDDFEDFVTILKHMESSLQQYRNEQRKR